MKVINPEMIRDFKEYTIQPKLNGIFAKWDGSRFMSKSDDKITSVAHINPACPVGTEGELYCHGMAFQRINQIVMQGTDFLQEISFHPHEQVKKYTVGSYDEFDRLYKRILKNGYEGVVLTDNFSGEKYKHKPRFDMEAVIVGFNPGTGKNESTFGSLRLMTASGQEFNCSGMSDRDRMRLWLNRSIGATVTVSYQFLSERGVPVSPSFEDYRHDETVKITHGGKRDGSGRKPKPAKEKRTVRRMYRFTEDEYKTIKGAAEAAGVKEADFVRKAIMNYVIGG